MKTMYKKVLIICMLLVVIFCLAGCDEALPESLTEYDYKSPRPLVYEETDPLKVEQDKISEFCGNIKEEERVHGVFRYSVYENGIQIDGLEPDCTETVINIPAEIEGKNVLGIAGKAFCDNTKIKEVSIPRNVKYIGASAFKRCEQLEKIELNEGLVFVGERTFDNCKKLTEVIFPNTVTYIGEYVCALSGVENISIPSEVERVPTGMYYGTAIKNFELPVYVTHLYKSAFAKCRNLTDITIHGNVEYIGQTAFANCINLKTVTVDEGCKEICYGVFEGDISLEKVYLPESVEAFSSSILPDANKEVILYLKAGSKAEEIAISSKYNYELIN